MVVVGEMVVVGVPARDGCRRDGRRRRSSKTGPIFYPQKVQQLNEKDSPAPITSVNCSSHCSHKRLCSRLLFFPLLPQTKKPKKFSTPQTLHLLHSCIHQFETNHGPVPVPGPPGGPVEGLWRARERGVNPRVHERSEDDQVPHPGGAGLHLRFHEDEADQRGLGPGTVGCLMKQINEDSGRER